MALPKGLEMIRLRLNENTERQVEYFVKIAEILNEIKNENPKTEPRVKEIVKLLVEISNGIMERTKLSIEVFDRLFSK